MALNFFKQRDIDEMDVNDIPEEFINYLETLDEVRKAELLFSRPDIAKVLNVSIIDSNQEQSQIVQAKDRESESVVMSNDDRDIWHSENIDQENNREEEVDEELISIQDNYYDGKKITAMLEDNMEPLEVLAVPDKTDKCIVHHIPFIEKQIKYTGKEATYGIVLKVCSQCNRIYMEESKKEYIHKALIKRNIVHTFYSLESSSQYLWSQLSTYEISDQEKIYISERCIGDNPLCFIHEVQLFKLPCIKRYKDRKVEFVGYFCDKCNKIQVRSSIASEIEDNCALNGVPIIETEALVKDQPKKWSFLEKIKPNYIVENGKREIYAYEQVADYLKLTEELPV